MFEFPRLLLKAVGIVAFAVLSVFLVLAGGVGLVYLVGGKVAAIVIVLVIALIVATLTVYDELATKERRNRR